MSDYLLTPELAELRGRVRAFVESHIIPAEQAIVDEDLAGHGETLKSLQKLARDEGLWTPHLPVEVGGLGLGIMGMCALFREMGRSLVGAKVFNCDAPDQGNMDLLLSTASAAARERWLRPLIDAQITSAFCMTEPAPGAGSDPSNLRTRATQDADGVWRINGHKWYSTGGSDASFLIVMARTSDDRRRGASMFLVDRHADGIDHLRNIPVMAPDLLAHKEAEFTFTDVAAAEVLGNIGDGFMLAQKRLVPARLTHCMRWLGLADRTLNMCRAYIGERMSFGQVLARHQMTQLKIATNARDIHAGNLMTLHCAQMLEQGLGKQARPYSSMCKDHVANTLLRTLDDAIQMHGGLGYSQDKPFGTWYRFCRSARLADGPDEVHRMVVARDFLMGRLDLLV